MRSRKRERKAPQQGLKAAKLDRSSLPPSHRILILMKLPVIALFSPLRPFEHEKLKKHKFQELRITVWPGATQQTPAMTDLLFKASGSCFHQKILVFCFFSSVTPPANAICLFLKSQLQDALPARVLFLGGLHNQGPASRSLLLLADCCLQPNPTAWRNLKYSLLNCGARVGLEPYQALTAEEDYTPNFKHGETKSTSWSRIRRAFLPSFRRTLHQKFLHSRKLSY